MKNSNEIKNWVTAILVNDEASTDRELVEHFMAEGPMPEAAAMYYVAQRDRALRNPLGFVLE